MEDKEIKNIFTDNEEFVASTKKDFAQQRIFGEIWLLRGLFKLIKRRKTIPVFILASVAIQIYLFIAVIGLMIITGVSITILKQGKHAIFLTLFSPFIIFTIFALLLAIKLGKKLLAVSLEYTKSPRIISWFIFIIFTILNAFFLYQIFLIGKDINFII